VVLSRTTEIRSAQSAEHACRPLTQFRPLPHRPMMSQPLPRRPMTPRFSRHLRVASMARSAIITQTSQLLRNAPAAENTYARTALMRTRLLPESMQISACAMTAARRLWPRMSNYSKSRNQKLLLRLSLQLSE